MTNENTNTEKTPAQLAVEARANAARVKTFVKAAQAALKAAWHRNNFPPDNPRMAPPTVNVLEDEAEAASDLETARLCGELAAANDAYCLAQEVAVKTMSAAMDAAFLAGKNAWRQRNAIERACDHACSDESAKLNVWKAAEWFGVLGSQVTQAHELGITATSTDEDLAAIARVELAGAGSDLDEIEGLDAYLVTLRDAMRNAT